MIEEGVIQRALGAALATGGEFAEIFAEDRLSSSAFFDDGRVEELSSGRTRGVGVRVVVGESTGFAHTADLSEARTGRRGPGGCVRGPRWRAAGSAPSRSTVTTSRPRTA